MWPIVQVRYMSKTILKYHDWSDQVQFMTKTKEDNDMIDHIGVVYVENDDKLPWSIWSSVDCNQNQIRQLCDW